MNEVVIDVSRAQARLAKLGRGLDTHTMLTAIGFRLLKWVDDNFKAGGIEHKWAPLRPNTVAARRKGSSAILQDTGRLKQSFVQKVDRESVTVGSSLLLAEWHHYGTRPYEIRPKRAKALRFVTAGGVVFSQVVHHPGLPARPLVPSEHAAGEVSRGVVEALVNRAVAEAK